ncbi:hypothetical protein [Vogesella indigofera]|uniref:hypothetical protein n=1 Tax=Vogesella indigofera TaxID=45465 RepID=UPI00234E6A5E|nr:hypothetical protein [Vogesella indigofera]MDC7698313.1 hypothetical protein [Vogesella indigofera]
MNSTVDTSFSPLPLSASCRTRPLLQALSGKGSTRLLIDAAWRAPNASDAYYAGVLAADWERKTLEIRYQVALPGRPHGLVPEAGGGLLVNSLRPGTWLLRCDGNGKVQQQVDVSTVSASVRLSGHIAIGNEFLYPLRSSSHNDRCSARLNISSSRPATFPFGTGTGRRPNQINSFK